MSDNSSSVRVLIGWALAFAACSPPEPLTVFAGADTAAAAGLFAEFVPAHSVVVKQSADPMGDAAHATGPRAALVVDLTCGDCYRLDPAAPEAVVVHAGSLLGAQYGLAQLLELGGMRFYHPRRALAPARVTVPASSLEYGVTVTPAKKVRGLHLHTLHPIEAYFDFWEPSPEHLDGAKRVIDWLVKNRGNQLDWVALDNIAKDPQAASAWHDHTRAILDYAHARGIRVGIGVELFHSGNLQLAYDLLADADLTLADPRPIMAQKLGVVVGDLPFDTLALTFGEFFGATPDAFIKQINNAYDALQSVRPGMEMTGTIHVGNSPSQHVQYMGMQTLYYFLLRYANPAIVPWVHSVMYYDLFEDAGGAYLHNDFALHRQFVLDRLKRKQRVAYYPESAYWVAFDDSVPTYLPVYTYTRALDLASIDQQSLAAGGDPLGEHDLFSTGWEWGYWQNDYLTLRMTYRAPDRWQSPIEEMLAPYGAPGAALAGQIEALALAQHDALIGKRLAPYLAGTDFLIDAGGRAGVIAAPLRPRFSDVVAMAPAARDQYEATVLAALDQFATELRAIERAVSAIAISGDDPFYAEMRDGAAVDAGRAAFILALYRAAVAHARGQPVASLLATADSTLADARKVVARRHAHLHDPKPARLLVEATNATRYHYGYLNEADTLCYWVRDRAQFDEQVLGSTPTAPGCVLGF